MNPGMLAYLGSPYSKYGDGIETAFAEAALIAGRLLRAGIHVFSPIVHCHPIAFYCGLDPLDHKIWLPVCDVMMARCDTLIIAHMEGWRESVGIKHEVAFFERAGKPIFDLPDIATCTLVRRQSVVPPVADHQHERTTQPGDNHASDN